MNKKKLEVVVANKNQGSSWWTFYRHIFFLKQNNKCI